MSTPLRQKERDRKKERLRERKNETRRLCINKALKLQFNVIEICEILVNVGIS